MSRKRAAPPRGLCIFVAATLLAVGANAGAQNYKVEIRPTLNDLDIKIEPRPSSGILVVRLTNNETKRVRCDLRYDASPQPLLRTTTFVSPGKTAQSVFRASRHWMRVIVDVACRPV